MEKNILYLFIEQLKLNVGENTKDISKIAENSYKLNTKWSYCRMMINIINHASNT